jgi:DNA-binding beta-propeller fold protein YncE
MASQRIQQMLAVFAAFFIAIVFGPAGHCGDRAPQPLKKVYWTDVAAGTISRSNTDGTHVEVMISRLNSPRGIAVDVTSGFMYFTMSSLSAGDSGKVTRADLDGSNLQVLVDGLHVPRGIALDVEDGRMYWSDYGGGTTLLKRANLDGSDVQTIVFDAEAYELALDLRQRKVYWTHVNNDTGGVGHRQIRRAGLDGSNVETVLDDLGTPDGVALDVPNRKMYWTDQSYHSISRANFDGSQREVLVITEPDSRPFGIDLDLKDRKMYWVDWECDVVRQCNLDGTGLKTLLAVGLVQPLGVALSVEDQR